MRDGGLPAIRAVCRLSDGSKLTDAHPPGSSKTEQAKISSNEMRQSPSPYLCYHECDDQRNLLALLLRSTTELDILCDDLCCFSGTPRDDPLQTRRGAKGNCGDLACGEVGWSTAARGSSQIQVCCLFLTCFYNLYIAYDLVYGVVCVSEGCTL